MKRLLFFVAFTAALISCEEVLAPDNNDGTEPVVFGVENKEITVSAKASSAQVIFSSSDDWTASLANDRASSWIELASSRGGAGENLSLGLTFCKNEDDVDRSAVVRLVSGNESIDVVVTQKHEGTILMSPSRLEASRDGRSFSIDMADDGDFSYEIIGQAKEWIEAVPTKAGADNSLQFTVSPNPGKKRRSGNIVFMANSVSETVTIYQAGEADAQDMVISSRSYETASDGENVQIEIAYGRRVSLVIPESYGWIKEVNPASTNTYNLDIAANDGYEHRIGYVLVMDEVTGKTESVSILQWQKDAIVFSKDKYDIALGGGEIDLKFAANCDYEVEILPAGTDWVTPVITRSMADHAETFEVAPAAAGTDRSCVIAFSNGKVRQEITVRQWACDAPITFADPIVKERCVLLYDTDGDNELSYIEASEVRSIANLFCEVEPVRKMNAAGDIVVDYRETGVTYGDDITSFDELRYFTGLVEIPMYAFYRCGQLTSLTLPSSIESIGSFAFLGVYQLKELGFPEGIRIIRSIPPRLETLILPEGVEIVELTRNLKTISMPASIRLISAFALDLQENKSIAWSGTAVTSDKRFVVNDEGELLLYLGSDADCVVPEGVRSIPPYSVLSMTTSSVTSLSLPSTLEIPEQNCLICFENLGSVRGKFAASDGKSLVYEGKLIGVAPVAESYEFPASVMSVCEGAFRNCRNIKEITLPLWMSNLPKSMFYGCTSLEKVNNIQNLKRLEDFAFCRCDKLLKKFKVPAKVNYIGNSALYSSVGGSIIEFESLTPPELYADWNEDGESIEAVFGLGTTVYVPDMAFDKYNSYTYSSVWPKVEARKVSVLYSEPEVGVKAEGEDMIVTIGEVSYRFIKVQKGSFSRSVPQTGEQVTVNLTRDFYIGQTEVPQNFWDALTHFNPSVYPGWDCPVISVSYEDCVGFAKKLSELTSRNFRLPTEAEWEYASLGGHRTGGNTADYVAANVEVFRGVPNALGLHCMFGNVWEYCEDDYSAWTDMASVPSGNDPLVEIEGSVNKVVRGGDLVGRRAANKSNSQNSQYGFRLVLTM